MIRDEMTPLERTMTTLSHKEPDRVPHFLLVTMHGAKALNISIEEYFSRPEYVVKGQEVLRKKYGYDCLNPFHYGAIDAEAFGSDVLYFKDGPPNAGRPILSSPDDISSLEVPDVADCSCLGRVLETTRILYERYGDTVPIPGVVISPFSLPVMQMGFEGYLNLLLMNRPAFWSLMEINTAFCIDWANAQLEAGATAIVYFDPVSSPTILTPDQFRETGFLVAKDTIAKINGACMTHFASGRCLAIADDLPATGTIGLGVSALEDLAVLKETFRGKLTLVGNLDGVSMARWTPQEAEAAVQVAISKGAKGGGYILSDNHGEIPYQVSDDVLLAICDAARRYGRYE